LPLLLLLHVQLPSVDSVEYWRSPDKAGWLQSQSEVMKMWRRRWFVLKQGYLFRFLSPDVSGEAALCANTSWSTYSSSVSSISASST
jgi:hypothetical protein